MKQTNRFWKFVIVFSLATLFSISCILIFLLDRLTAPQVQTLIDIANDQSIYLVSIGLILFVVAFSGLEIIFHTYIKPLKKISAEASVIYSSNPSHRLKISGNKDVRNLSAVINDFADMFENLNKNITEQILTVRKETEKERNLLASIMAEMPQGVIICTRNGRILLFNSLAKEIFTGKNRSDRSEYFIGLGRSIFHLIDKNLIAHALEDIEERLSNLQSSVASYFITPIHTGQLISVETIPVLNPDKEMTGFILTLQDVTDDVFQYDTTHENLIRMKQGLVNHQNLLKRLSESDPAILSQNPEMGARLMETIDTVANEYQSFSDTILDTILTRIPLTKIPIADFLFSLQKKADTRHGITLTIEGTIENCRMLADTYSFNAAFGFVLKKLLQITGNTRYTISAGKERRLIGFRISWADRPVEKILIDNILQERINGLPNLVYILKQNNAEFETLCDKNGACSQIEIRVQAEPKTPGKQKLRAPVITGSRPEFYDFNLFGADDSHRDLMDTNLKEITYTVFDTETTGLNPEGGDEIISIAAVRIVNNRIVYQDIFEELVDPKRDIPIESYKIHGINYEMVTGKKDIESILPVFKKFASETVLVGHNIAFDMKMIKVKEKTTGVRFKNPVMDTLLLSAILHPLHMQHDMESIAKRLGVNIIGRHTALGDAIATAEIFLKLMPILNSNGILTLRDALKASKKTYYARLKY